MRKQLQVRLVCEGWIVCVLVYGFWSVPTVAHHGTRAAGGVAATAGEAGMPSWLNVALSSAISCRLQRGSWEGGGQASAPAWCHSLALCTN